MNTKLKQVINSIEPEFTSNNNFFRPLPEGVSIYLDNEDYLIEIDLINNVLEANIYIGEDKYNLTEEDLDFIYNHLNELLEHQIRLTKDYYQEEEYYRRY